MSKNIAILMGGYSSEYEISIKSGNMVYNTLSKSSNDNFFKVIIKKNKWYHLDEYDKKFPINKEKFEIIKNNLNIKIDIVFNTVHGEPGENGEIQSYFENLEIMQTSSNSKSSQLTFNKKECKKKVEELGILTPKSILIKKGVFYKKYNKILNLKFPIFIKPNEGGSSFGISKIKNEKDIIKGLKKCYKENSDALIEEEIYGREISVGVITYKDKVTALPPTEIIPHNEYFDFDAKYKGESEEITPAKIGFDKIDEVKNLAISIYRKLNLKGITRSDFILKNEKFYFLEINTNPGLTKESILPQQAKAYGIELEELFKSVLT